LTRCGAAGRLAPSRTDADISLAEVLPVLTAAIVESPRLRAAAVPFGILSSHSPRA
jgi:hypothetical protein